MRVDYRDLNAVVGGRSLRDWYDRVLSYDYGYRYTEGEAVRLWAWNEGLDDAISRLLEELEEWEEWGKLQEEEKEVLRECFVKVMADVWRYSWEVIRDVLSDKPHILAECRDWREGTFSRSAIEEAILRMSKIGLTRNKREQDVVKDIVQKLVEGENKEWKEWLGRKVWLNLVEEILE
jgi:hypothetical protein